MHEITIDLPLDSHYTILPHSMLKTFMMTKAAKSVFPILALLSVLLLASCTNPPIAKFAMERNQAETGQQVRFTDQSIGDITAWAWDFGDGITSNEQNPQHVYDKPGNFIVTLNVSNKVGSNSMNSMISVLQPPKAVIATDRNVVGIEQEIHFSEQSTGNITSYLWDFTDGQTSSDRNASHSFAKKGHYNVSLKVSNELSSDTANQTIIVLDRPTSGFIVSQNQTKGQPIQFKDNSVGESISYLWDFGDGITSTIQNPIHIYSKKGDYTVSLTASNPAGNNVRSLFITVFDPVVSGFSASKTKVLIGDKVDFSDESTGDIESRLWDFGDNETSTQWKPTHAYKAAGNYTVTLRVSNPVSSNVTIKQDYIHVSPLAAKIVFATNVTQTGEYTPNPDTIFKPGEDIWAIFEVTGFDQKRTQDGYEVWLKVQEAQVGSFKASLDVKDVLEVHETNPTPAQTIRLWLYVGSYQPTAPAYMYLGFVEATIEDEFTGFTVTSSYSFLVKQ
jgi:PKD repeat protein